MILVVKIKLLADAAQLDALTRTLETCNAAATSVAKAAFEREVTGKRDLRAITYKDTRDNFKLGSQVAQSCIRKTADAYKTLQANARAGRLGAPGSKRWAKALGKPIEFDQWAAQPFDDRCLSWIHNTSTPVDGEPCGTVSIWTVDGRCKDIPFTGFPDHIHDLRQYRSGETDLVIEPHRRTGKPVVYLIACVDLPDKPVNIGDHLFDPTGWIGVDMGIVNPAVTSDRALSDELMRAFGEHPDDVQPETPATTPKKKRGGTTSVKQRRIRNRETREGLQRKKTKSAKRLLKKRARKEARYARDVNQRISNTIVSEAQRTGRGIAIERLTGIRERVRHRKPQRADMSSWAYAQLGEFLIYKAQRAGVPLIVVDPRNTSRTCPRPDCRHIDKRNRPSQAVFVCLKCGYRDHADLVGGDNIALIAPETWAQSMVPSAA